MRQTIPRRVLRFAGALAFSAMLIGSAAAPASAGVLTDAPSISTIVQTVKKPVVKPLDSWQKKHWYGAGHTFRLWGSSMKNITKVTVGGKTAGIVSKTNSVIKIRPVDFSTSAKRSVKVYAGSKVVYSGAIHVSKYTVVFKTLSKSQLNNTYRSTAWMTINGSQLEHVTKVTVNGKSMKLTNRSTTKLRSYLPAVTKTGKYPVTMYDGSKKVRTQYVKIKKYVPEVRTISKAQQDNWYNSKAWMTINGESLELIDQAIIDGKSVEIFNRSTNTFRVRMPQVNTSGIYAVTLKSKGKVISQQRIHISKTTKTKVADSIDIGTWPTTGIGHVQGLAIDEERGFLYYSMTTILVKTDLQGKVLGTMTGFDAHMGDLTVNAETGEVYATLEYDSQTAWTIGVIDALKLTKKNVDAEKSGLVDTVYLDEITKDYNVDVNGDGKLDGDDPSAMDHRYGAGGIDGITFGPSFKTGKADTLTVAYGIYKNVKRTDNDNQILLQYDISDWDQYRKPLNQKKVAKVGPENPEGKYFITTGNTNWGVQNLVYDPTRKIYVMSAYLGTKKNWPNYGMFAINASAKATTASDGRTFLPLATAGKTDPATGVSGWPVRNPYGLAVLSDGTWLVNTNTGKDGARGAVTTRYVFTMSAENPFS